jgi:hypothetical protein
MRRSSLRRAAGSRLRGLGLAFVLAVFASSVTVGMALACTSRGEAACGPIRFQGAPTSLNVGVEIGSTCLEPGTTDYSVTLTGPNGFNQVIAQGSVNPPAPIVPQSIFAVPVAGKYRLVYTTTTNRGETLDCVTGTTELMVDVPEGAQPTPEATPSASPSPSPSASESPSPSPDVTPRPTKTPRPTVEVSAAPTDQGGSGAPSDQPSGAASEVPAGSVEPSPADTASPGTSGGAGGGGGGGGPDLITVALVGLIIVGGIGAAVAVLLYIRSGQAADAPWKAGPWKCARCNAINREGTDRCRRCYARWDGTS